MQCHLLDTCREIFQGTAYRDQWWCIYGSGIKGKKEKKKHHHCCSMPVQSTPLSLWCICSDFPVHKEKIARQLRRMKDKSSHMPSHVGLGNMLLLYPRAPGWWFSFPGSTSSSFLLVFMQEGKKTQWNWVVNV